MAPRKYLLTNGNRELAKDGVFTWTLPALSARLSSSEIFVTCPNAGVCAKLCYARSGTFNFSNVKKAHTAKLEMLLDDLEGWKAQMLDELTAKRYRGGKYVRIHDSGDFFSVDYFDAWVQIAKQTPDVVFYAYTKEVQMVKTYGLLPSNFVIIFSMGGKQDNLVDKEVDRHADVFPTLEALESAGYSDQGESDILAVTLPSNKVGIVVNNIPHLKKKQGMATFASLQAERDERLLKSRQ
jgi:Gene product 88